MCFSHPLTSASASIRCLPSIQSELVLPARTQLSVLGDEICQGVQFTEEGYFNYINSAIKNFLLADLFESAVEAYGLMLPIFMAKRYTHKHTIIIIMNSTL